MKKELKKYMLIRGHDGAISIWEYIDDVTKARSYWYIDQAIDKYGIDRVMPVVMNRLGGYHTHRPDDNDVEGIIEAVDWPTLKLWQQYPKNQTDFTTGWISPTGDTYKCGVYDHIDCAMSIAGQLYGEHTKTICDDFLLKLGWFKATNKKYIGHMRKLSAAQAEYFLANGFRNELDLEELM